MESSGSSNSLGDFLVSSIANPSRLMDEVAVDEALASSSASSAQLLCAGGAAVAVATVGESVATVGVSAATVGVAVAEDSAMVVADESESRSVLKFGVTERNRESR